MYIAQQLKEKNIAEYLLYMWQVEDILRAHHLDPDELKQNYLAQFRATEETEKEMEEWYSHLSDTIPRSDARPLFRTLSEYHVRNPGWHGCR